MSDIESIWREKSDEDLLEAAARLDDYTEEGQVVIREEMKRRGMEDPVEQAGDVAAETMTEEGEIEEMAVPEPRCLRCDAKMRFRGTRTLLGEVGSLFASADEFDLYVCPRCGHADLFVNEIGAETAGE